MKRTIFLIPAAFALAACQAEPPAGGAVMSAADKAIASNAGTSPGKPSAPVTLDYEILGNAVVGQPLAVRLSFSTPAKDTPIEVSYYLPDPDSLLLADAQPQKINVSLRPDELSAERQVTVVPQREGRVYLNVTAELGGFGGGQLKSMSIPISVGPGAPVSPEANGEVLESADGELVNSLPAREN